MTPLGCLGCKTSTQTKDPDQLASEKANLPGSALFVIKYVNFYQKHRSSNLIGWKWEVGMAIYSTWQRLVVLLALCLSLLTVYYFSFDISQKDGFCLAFNFKWNVLVWLTISYQKPFVLSVSVFCSQIFTLTLNLLPKNSPTYAISIIKWCFGSFV